jgi:hypothetical protein
MNGKNTMKNRLLPIIFLASALSATAIQAADPEIEVKARSAPRSGIESLNTYCIVKAADEGSTQTINDLSGDFPDLASWIESALERNLVAKGFKNSGNDACDFEMHYQVSMTEQTQLSSKKKYHSTGVTSPMDERAKVRMGSLMLHAYNPAQQRKIWVGQATKTGGTVINLSKPSAPDDNQVQANINTGVDELFLRFPARNVQ